MPHAKTLSPAQYSQRQDTKTDAVTDNDTDTHTHTHTYTYAKHPNLNKASQHPAIRSATLPGATIRFGTLTLL